MIRIFILFIAVLLFNNSFCQTKESVINKNLIDSLEGKWRGKFYDQRSNQTISIEIIFRRKKEMLKIFSYSYIFDKVIICEMELKQLSGDSIRLIEYVAIQPKRTYNLCFQTMDILVKLENNELIMTGIWESARNEECGSGGLYLKKDIKK